MVQTRAADEVLESGNEIKGGVSGEKCLSRQGPPTLPLCIPTLERFKNEQTRNRISTGHPLPLQPSGEAGALGGADDLS